MARIVSFLPAGTEIVHALGAGAELIGRSQECDHPASVLALPIVSRPALDLANAAPDEIDRAVAEQVQSGASMYRIDELLRELAPDVVITQDLCRVCAPSGTELSRAVKSFGVVPDVLYLTPHTVAEIEDNILSVGAAIGRVERARELVHHNRSRIARVRAATKASRPPRVVFLEWTNPLFCAGHWVPEMIALAGGNDPLGRAGADSVRIEWEDVLAVAPEVILVSPCGFGLEQSTRLAQPIRSATSARVIAVDANAYFARPGPRIAEAVELLGHLMHPTIVPWTADTRPWAEFPLPA